MYEARLLFGFLFKILVSRIFLNLMIDRVWTPLLSFFLKSGEVKNSLFED